MSTLELYIWENRVMEVVMFIVKKIQIGMKLALIKLTSKKKGTKAGLKITTLDFLKVS